MAQKPIGLRIDPALLARVDAARNGMPRAQWIAAALERALADETPRPSPAGRQAKSEAVKEPARPAAASRPGASRPSVPASTPSAHTHALERQAKLNKAKGMVT